jgi:serine/threonine protein phosphatase PrpC
MEDTHVHLDSVVTQSPWQKVAYYGVYDGHGGVCNDKSFSLTSKKNTADFVQEELHKTVFGTEAFKAGNPKEALSQAFEDVDRRIIEIANNEGWMNGSTAVVGLLLDKTLYMANVGDAEACLVKFGYDTKVAFSH